ncbi:MAG: hypothetical protein IH604_15800 [Burkholderiales bacterium]|nr:hypothetical protein [Burkholderiales bacterium]
MRTARGFIGTPFHHMGRLPGVGLDCSGVLICLGRDLGLVAASFDVPAYTPGANGVAMLEWCSVHMTPVPRSQMAPGDAVLTITDAEPQHLGIVGDYRNGGLSIIHASNQANPPRVIETRLMFSRILRFAAAYRLPGIE